MERKEAIEVVKKNWPDSSFTMLREALETLVPELKESENISLPKFTFDDVLALQCAMEAAKKVQKDKDLYEQLKSLHDRLHDAYWLKKQGEQSKKHDVCDNCEQQGSCVSPCPMKLVEKHGEQKPAWGKEDERYLSYAIHAVEDMLGDNGKNIVAWLKSLKERYTWKPSEEQMEALDFAANCIVPAEFCVKRKVLKELLEQIKKLR